MRGQEQLVLVPTHSLLRHHDVKKAGCGHIDTFDDEYAALIPDALGNQRLA